MTRVEVGLQFSLDRFPNLPLFSRAFSDLLERLLRLETRVSSSSRGRPLFLQGLGLSKLYSKATAEKGGFQVESSEQIESGRPLVLVEVKDGEIQRWPTGFKEAGLELGGQGGAAFGWFDVENTTLPVWLLVRGESAKDRFRSLRLCLLRLHAEKESLDFVLRHVRRGVIPYVPRTPAGDFLEEYLNEATDIINRTRWHGIQQSAVEAAALGSELVAYPDEHQDLVQRLEGARRQVVKKLEEFERERNALRMITKVVRVEGGVYVENEGQIILGGTFHGPVVNKVEAERIEGSFNTFNSAGPPEDLRQAMKELHDVVQTLVSRLPSESEEKEKALSNLETFSAQASKKKPLADVLKVTGKGLVDAAKTVADLVGPITTAVSGVLKLFALVL